MKKLVLVALVVAGCKKKDPPPPPPPAIADAGPSARAPDAEVELPEGPDEATLRAGKRTGLGGPDETPEVATEDFVRALVEGKAAWTRVVAPGAGVVELRAAEHRMQRRCGAEVDAGLAALASAVSAALGDATRGAALECDNADLAGPPPQSAICTLDSGADAAAYDLIFVPDPTLGLRLVGYTLLADGLADDADLDAFDLELARTGKLCP